MLNKNYFAMGSPKRAEHRDVHPVWKIIFQHLLSHQPPPFHGVLGRYTPALISRLVKNFIFVAGRCCCREWGWCRL